MASGRAADTVYMLMSRKLFLALFIIALAPATVKAWLYPEHRNITSIAVIHIGRTEPRPKLSDKLSIKQNR